MRINRPTLDSLLGPAEGRYFGSGFAQVNASVGQLECGRRNSEGFTATGTARISFDGLWSRKGARIGVPHLSTVDVIRLAFQATEKALRLVASTSWRVASIEVRAPARPIESGFESIPLAIHFQEEIDTASSTVTLAGFTAVVSLAPAEGRVADDGLRGDCWGVFRTRVPQLGGIELHNGRIRSSVGVPPTMEGVPGALLNEFCAGSLNIIDAFVAVLQLGQVLLYELDGLTREASDTLWMRTTRIDAGSCSARASDITVTLEDSRLRTLRNEPWRLATISGDLRGLFKVSCAVAHRLPTAQAMPRGQH